MADGTAALAVGPRIVFPRQRESHRAARHVVDVVLAVRQRRQVRLEKAIGLHAEDAADFSVFQQREDAGEVLALVAVRRFREHAVVRLASQREAEVAGLQLRVGFFRRERFAEFFAAFASHAIAPARRSHEVALVGGVYEKARADLFAMIFFINKDGDFERTRFTVGAAFRGVECARAPECDVRLGGDHFLQHELADLRLGVRAAEIFRLRRVCAVRVAVVRLHTFCEIEEGAGDAFEGAKIGVRKSVGDHAADAIGRLDEQHFFPILRGGESGGDAGGRGAVHEQIRLLRGETRGDEEEKRGQSGHPRIVMRQGAR